MSFLRRAMWLLPLLGCDPIEVVDTDPVDTPDTVVDTDVVDTDVIDTDPGTPSDAWELDEVIPVGLMPEDGLFRIDRITDIRIDLTSRNRQSLSSNPTAYVDAELTMYGTTFQVGMRLKGSSTMRPIGQKASMKIAVDYSVPGQEIFGWEGFNLHNDIADASYIGDVLSHKILREAGIPSLRSGYANVWIDGELQGLYSVMQRKDSDWLEEWYSDPEGSLYEGLGCDFGGGGWGGGGANCWNLDQQGANDTRQDLEAMVAEMNTSGPAFWTAFRRNFDEDSTIRELAGQWVVGHWDSYSGNLNNYHIYHEPTSDLWTMSTWSLDLAFGRPVGGGCNQYGRDKSNYRSSVLAQRCQDDPICDAQLERHADEIMTVIETYDWQQVITDIERMIEPSVVADPFGPGRNRWTSELRCVEDFLTNRRQDLRL